MSHRSILISATISLLMFSTSGRAQEPSPAPSPDTAAATKEKAFKLLETVAGQVDTLRSAENRARIGSNVAELLWSHDERRARSLLAAAEEDIKSGMNTNDPDEQSRLGTLLVFYKLRGDIVGRIAGHDPDFALKFLRTTRLAEDENLPRQMKDADSALELRVATQLAAKNSELALSVGRKSLEKGFSDDLLPLLAQLQEKDKDAAVTFYKEILDKLRGTNLGRDLTAFQFTVNMARSFTPPAVDERLHRELVGLALEGAVAQGCENDETYNYVCHALGSIFPNIDKYYGARATRLRRWAMEAQAAEEREADSARQAERFNELAEKGSADEILTFAQDHPEVESQLYWTATDKAAASGDFARARQIATKLPDEEGRKEMLAEIDREQSFASMKPEALSEIQQAVDRLRSSEERIKMLINGAARIGGYNRRGALTLLDMAGQIIESSKPGKTQIEGQIPLALLYAALKSDRGFSIMESLIPRLNELVGAAATLDGVENNYLRDGEWAMTGEGTLGRLLTALAQNAAYFATLDFDRSVNLASQFERPEIRLMAQEKIAQAVLSGQSSVPFFQTSTLDR